MKNTMPPWMIGLIISLFPVYFAALWTFVVFILSRLGWSPLARSFRATSQPTGTTFRMVSASMRGCNYNNCLTAIVANEGLWLQPWLPFRMFHPALLIPWRAFSPFEEQQILWITRYATIVTTPEGQRIKMFLMPKSLENAMRQHMGTTAVEIAPQPRSSPWSN